MSQKKFKTKIVRVMLVVITLCLLIVACSSWKGNHRLSVDQMLADFDYLSEVLQRNYPYFEALERMSGYNWLATLDTYRARIRSAKNDMHFISILGDILGDFNQGHTGLVTPDFYELLLDSYSAKTDEYDLHRWVDILQKPTVQHRYSWWAKRDSGRVVRKGGNVASGFSCNILEPDRIAYMRLRHFLPAYIDSDREEIMGFLSRIRSFPFLIIDIRGNPGGSDLYWEGNIVAPLIAEPLKYTTYSVVTGDEYGRSFIRQEIKPVMLLPGGLHYPPEVGKRLSFFIEEENVINPRDSVGFDGEIILLVDNQVFSSAATFAAFAQLTNWATVVGQATKGDGISMDSILLSLPNSGLVIRFPVAMGLNPDGSSNLERGTVPDIVIPNDEDSLAVVLRSIKEE